jgi:hypothetical protein
VAARPMRRESSIRSEQHIGCLLHKGPGCNMRSQSSPRPSDKAAGGACSHQTTMKPVLTEKVVWNETATVVAVVIVVVVVVVVVVVGVVVVKGVVVVIVIVTVVVVVVVVVELFDAF